MYEELLLKDIYILFIKEEIEKVWNEWKDS